jgi:hypothetical protein
MEQSDTNKEVSYIKDCLVEWISNFEFKPISDNNLQFSWVINKDITLHIPKGVSIHIIDGNIHLTNSNSSVIPSDST